MRKPTRHFELFGKLTAAYFRAERKANGEPVGVQSRGSMDHSPADYSPTDHKNDQKREPSPPPHTVAVGSVSQPQDKTSSPAVSRTPEEEEGVRQSADSLRLLMTELDKKARVRP